MAQDDGTRPPGLIASLGLVTRNALALLLNRLELAALELAQVRNHLLQLVVVFALAVLLGGFALIYASITIVYLAWAVIGWVILPIITVVFLLVAIGLILYARAMLRSGKLTLPATMAELKSDRDMLV
ncbi:phage holin family protein [Duganella sp. FT94W]|uniref:Phage holin family protein n=1 Tax=Duganella lactea TaxID=2692173 RepID=A0ABW9VEN7_9BURK|nr:phage holin family protein [Duganella lactea]MYM37058.1 phage holin family protein [Duganella lactea]